MGDSRPVFTLDEVLITIGFGNYQYLLLAYGGLGWIAEAMEMMILSFIGSAVQSEWDLSPGEKSLISTVVFAGMLIGASFWGLVSDTYGRKKGILSVVTITAVAGLLSAFSPNYFSLIIVRCVAGVGLGGMHIFTSWFLEFVPTPNRGVWMIVLSSFWTIGTILEAALAWIIMPSFGWRCGQSKCATITLNSGKSQSSSLYVDVFFTSLAELPGLILSAFIVDRVGRKLSMVIMFVLGSILLLPLLTHQNEILTMTLLFGARTFISATFVVACIYAPEVYPTNARTTGVGIATAIGRIGGMVCPLVAVGLVNGCHQAAAVILFEITILVSGLSVLLSPFETNGRNLADTVVLNRQSDDIDYFIS